MAVKPWPDFSRALPGDYSAMEAIVSALRERAAAAGVTLSAPEAATPLAPISHGVLIWIRASIMMLAPNFIDMDYDYAAHVWSDFPHAYTATDIAVGAHSLSAFPAKWDFCEHDPDSLARFRAFMGNAAWWLRKFRYIAATGHYSRRSVAYGSGTEGATRDALASPTNEDNLHDPVGSVNTCFLALSRSSSDYGMTVSTDESISATWYSGLTVENATGFRPALYVAGCAEQVDRYEESESTASGASATRTEIYKRYVNGLKIWLEKTFSGTLDGLYSSDYTGDETREDTAWDAFGTEYLKTTSTSETTHTFIGQDSYAYSFLDSHVDTFHGFVVGVSLAVSNVAPWAETRVTDLATRIPEPSSLDAATPLDDHADWSHVRTSLVGNVKATLRLAPFFDFNNCYGYRDS